MTRDMLNHLLDELQEIETYLDSQGEPMLRTSEEDVLRDIRMICNIKEGE